MSKIATYVYPSIINCHTNCEVLCMKKEKTHCLQPLEIIHNSTYKLIKIVLTNMYRLCKKLNKQSGVIYILVNMILEATDVFS